MYTRALTSPSVENEKPIHVTILLIPQFCLMAFSGAIDPLRVANRLSGQKLFTWEILSVDGKPVSASNNVEIIVNKSIKDIKYIKFLIVCSSYQPERFETKPLLAWLQNQARHGAKIAGLDTGSHILAKAGLLDNYHVTLHWEAIAAFQEEFPHIHVSQKIFEVDRDRFTCAGGFSSLDMQLYLITQYVGKDLATKVANMFIYEPDRKSEPQGIDMPFKIEIKNSKMRAVLEIMEKNLEIRIPTDELASGVGISRRQLERLFRTHLNTSPREYYFRLRLIKAKQLLQQSSLSIMEIAIACGFSASSSFARAYHDQFGLPPSQDRNIFCPSMAGSQTSFGV